MKIAETNRLIVRNWNTSDIEEYAHIVSDPDVMKFIGNGKSQNFEEAESYVKRCITSIAKQGWARFAIEIKKTGELAGFCGFAHYNNELDFGWRYAKRFWGKGYGTEAAEIVLDLGIRKFNFPRIVCITYPENKGSIKIIKRIGMEFEREISLNGRIVKQYVKLNPQNTP